MGKKADAEARARGYWRLGVLQRWLADSPLLEHPAFAEPPRASNCWVSNSVNGSMQIRGRVFRTNGRRFHRSTSPLAYFLMGVHDPWVDKALLVLTAEQQALVEARCCETARRRSRS